MRMMAIALLVGLMAVGGCTYKQRYVTACLVGVCPPKAGSEAPAHIKMQVRANELYWSARRLTRPGALPRVYGY